MLHQKEYHFFFKFVVLVLIAFSISIYSLAQCKLSWEEINKIRHSPKTNTTIKLLALYRLKARAQKCGITEDSVHARLLDFIAALEFQQNGNYRKSLEFALESLRINRTGRKGSSPYFAMQGYYNVGYYYYMGLKMYDKSLLYFDSASFLAQKFNNADDVILDSRRFKALNHIKKGDYQKCLEESISGVEFALKKNDTLNYSHFLTLKAYALYYQNLHDKALIEIQEAIRIINLQNDLYNLRGALKLMAFIYAAKNNLRAADSCFQKTINYNLTLGDIQQIASDYKDFGILQVILEQFDQAGQNFYKALAYAKKIKDSIMLSTICINWEESCFAQKKYKEAEANCMYALKYLRINKGENILDGINTERLKRINDKELLFSIGTNLTKLLINFYRSSSDKKYLDACLENARITETIITGMRHEQTAEKSKLYWRDFSRTFFTNALEASFLANDPEMVFFFMEKSNAVLLNDKLNEIGALAKLPFNEAKKEENFRVAIADQQQMLGRLNLNSVEYKNRQETLLRSREAFEVFIKSLEKKHPPYYQYKYSDEVPSLTTLKEHISKTGQSFIHYFNTDTATYIISITKSGTKLTRLSRDQFSNDQLSALLELCAQKALLNTRYDKYAALSHTIYKKLFEPLKIPKGRVIICTDGFLVPFEALSTNPSGTNFLINDYAFSYVYSARYMLKEFKMNEPKGDFLGIAPVSFAPYLRMPDLTQSKKAIKTSAVYYYKPKLFTKKDATANNFLRFFPGYSVVNIFSHASADSSHEEPFLCMADSLIYLSQLQEISNPATRLVVLSACETHAGKNATGEGIYSLARGFALAGIPAVSATLWKADEATIYSITAEFNKNLASGMNKDEALQQAKLSFLNLNKNEKQLPYYWANMVLIGNTSPLNLSARSHSWWWVIAGILLSLCIFFYLRKKTRSHNSLPPILLIHHNT